jgi:hypothetical protein
MLSRVSETPYRVVLFFVVAVHFLAGASHSRAADGDNQYKDLQQSQALIEHLLQEHGSYSQTLIEPYSQLAQMQLSAFRLEDAKASVNNAIRNSRISNGLYSSEQLPLQKLLIEINATESDWNAVEKNLINLVSLVSAHANFVPAKTIKELQWASNVRLLAVREDTEDRLALHIINGTILHESMVVLAQKAGLTKTALYPQLLHSLANQYFLETTAIIAGGSTSYRLRLPSQGSNLVETRREAIEKRYKAGLDKLLMIKALAENPVSLAFSELSITDWNAVFDRSADISTDYERIYAQFVNTDAPIHDIDQLFASNRILPTMSLQLDFQHQNSATSPINVATASSVQVAELNQNLPGYGNHVMGFGTENEIGRSWDAVRAKIMLEPSQRKTVHTGGYRVKSFVTSKQIDIIDDGEINGFDLRSTTSRMKALSFRPVLRRGKVDASFVVVDYLVRSDDLSTSSNFVVLQ